MILSKYTIVKIFIIISKKNLKFLKASEYIKKSRKYNLLLKMTISSKKIIFIIIFLNFYIVVSTNKIKLLKIFSLFELV